MRYCSGYSLFIRLTIHESRQVLAPYFNALQWIFRRLRRRKWQKLRLVPRADYHPAVVRDALKLKAGTRIRFLEEADGRFSFVPVTGSIRAMKGIVPSLGRTVSLAEMDQAIAEGASRGMKPAR